MRCEIDHSVSWPLAAHDLAVHNGPGTGVVPSRARAIIGPGPAEAYLIPGFIPFGEPLGANRSYWMLHCGFCDIVMGSRGGEDVGEKAGRTP